jgi:SAM-dependent methyltransferase
MTHYVQDTLISEASCIICGDFERHVIGDRGRHFQKLTTVICKGCGLIHSHPIPTATELDEYYSMQYRSDYKMAYVPQRKHLLRYARGARQRLENLLLFTDISKKLLDVGSGSGEFIYLASLLGFDAQGIEPHEGYAIYSSRTFDIPVINRTLEKAEIPPESFDVVTLNHVLEHLPSPFASLAIINRWLKPGGLLAIEVPDIENTQHSPVNRFHFAHVYNFNHKTLVALLKKSGFLVLSHPDSNGTSLFAWKTADPEPQALVRMPENYAHLLHLMSRAVSDDAYRQKRPVRRFFRKCYKYPLEFLESLWLWNPRRIVRRESNRIKVA